MIEAKSACLHGVEFVQDLAFVGRVVAEDQPPDQPESLLGQEHVLGAAQPDPFGAEVAGMRGVVRGVGVGSHTDASRADQIGPPKQRLEFGRCRTGRGDDGTLDHVAGPSVDRDLAALGVEDVADTDAARRRGRRRRHRRRPGCPSRERRRRRGSPDPRGRSGCRGPTACRARHRVSSRCAPGSRRAPRSAASTAASALVTMRPDAAPGEAGNPVVRIV